MPVFTREAERPGLYATDVPRRFDPLGGLSTGDMLVDTAVSWGMSSLFGSRGFMPGQFFPTQNAYDQIAAARAQQQRMAAVQAGFAADEPEMIATMRGVVEGMGFSFGPGALATAQTIAGYGPTVMPFLAGFAPQTVDSLFGARGSRGVAADVLFRRGQHEVDPVTGRIGLTSDTVAARATGMYDALYSGDPGAGLGAVRGMGAGTTAGIYAEASRMGLTGRAIGSLDRGGLEAAVGGEATPEALRAFDARRSADVVKGLAGAVSAIRDLFGENGRPDAPMSTLFKALNDLTQGGLQFADPAKLESTVRTAQSLMRSGGITLDAYAALTAQAGSAAAAVGVDQSFGASIALGSAAAGSAFNAAGLGSFRGPGAFSRETYTGKDVQLRAAAIGSEQAQGLAALMTFQDTMGGLEGRDLELYEAVKAGRTTYADGTSIYMRPGEAMTRLARYVGPARAAEAMRARDANAAYIAKYDIGGTVRDLQPENFRRDATGYLEGALRQSGVAEADVAKAAAAGADAVLNMDGETASDRGKAQAALAEAFRSAGVGGEAATWAAYGGYNDLSVLAKSRYGMRLLGAQQAYNPEAVRQRRRIEEDARQEAGMAKALSALGRPGPLARLMDIVKGPAEGFVDAVAKFAGGIPIGDVGEALGADAESATAPQRLGVVARGVRATIAEYDAARNSDDPDAAAKAAAATADVATLVSGDAKQAQARLDAVLAAEKISKADVDEIMKGGQAGLPKGIAERVRALGFVAAGRGNLLGTAEAAGVRTRAVVSAKDVADLATRLGAAGKVDLAGLSDSERARAGKTAAGDLRAAADLARAAIGDESGQTLAELGAGGATDVVGKLDSIVKLDAEIMALAVREGKSVADLLGSKEEGGAAGEARTLQGRIAGLAGELKKTSGGPKEDYSALKKDDPRRKGWDDALGRAKGLRETNSKAAVRAEIDATLKQTGTSMSDSAKEALVDKAVASGDPGSVAAGLRAARAEEFGMREAEADGGTAAEVGGYAKRAGAIAGLRQGGASAGAEETARMFGEAVSGLVAPKKGKGADAGNAGAAGERTSFKATFAPGTTVRIEGDTMAFEGGLELESDLGTTST